MINILLYQLFIAYITKLLLDVSFLFVLKAGVEKEGRETMKNAWDIMETYFWDEKSGLYMVSYISLTYKKVIILYK